MKCVRAWMLWMLCAACSSPRYAYHFPQPASISLKAPEAVSPAIASPPEPRRQYSAEAAPEGVQPQPIFSHHAANRRQDPVSTTERVYQPSLTEGPVADAPTSAASLPHEGKLSIIFLAGSVVFLLIGGPVFTVLGSLSLLIGLIFGIKWFFRR